EPACAGRSSRRRIAPNPFGPPGLPPGRGQDARSVHDPAGGRAARRGSDRKSTRLNSSHVEISYAVFCLKKKKINKKITNQNGDKKILRCMSLCGNAALSRHQEIQNV